MTANKDQVIIGMLKAAITSIRVGITEGIPSALILQTIDKITETTEVMSTMTSAELSQYLIDNKPGGYEVNSDGDVVPLGKAFKDAKGMPWILVPPAGEVTEWFFVSPTNNRQGPYDSEAEAIREAEYNGCKEVRLR